MKQLIGSVLFMGWLLGGAAHAADSEVQQKFASQTAYDFSFAAIDDAPVPLSQYKGKVLLVVNTASECGFTPQYEGLEALWQQYKNKGLIILGVPSNDFGGQEPGSNAQIKQFCESKYSITFPLMGKVHVKGKDAHPFYQWAAHVKNGGGAPSWNFHKYLIGTNGQMLDYFSSITGPSSDTLKRAIDKALAQTETSRVHKQMKMQGFDLDEELDDAIDEETIGRK